MNRPTILILASDPAFAREITAHWPQDSAGSDPEFIVLDQAFSRGLEGSHYDLAIADSSSVSAKKGKRKFRHQPLDPNLKSALAATGKPAIVLHSDPACDFYHIQGSVIDLRRESGIWSAVAGLLGREILRRCQSESRAREAAKICAAAQAEATLGRYMLDLRINVNNALTTVLGNAELLANEPGLPATVQAQADTIRNMALRLHEVFQRFSSLEKELSVNARESGKKAARAGSY
ncbi:MAG: hypothetical protein WCF68_04685 [Terriglobales bacterium]